MDGDESKLGVDLGSGDVDGKTLGDVTMISILFWTEEGTTSRVIYIF